MIESQEHASRGSQASRRCRRREHDDDVARRAGKPEVCVQAGELSSARQCLEGAPVAPGTETRYLLFVIRRKGKWSHGTQSADVLEFQPGSPLELDVDGFSRSIRCAKRGVAGGPSRMTADHLRPILESEADTVALGRMATDLARADISLPILTALRMGRLTALQKQLEASEALSQVKSSAALSPAASPNKWRAQWRSQRHCFSTLYQQKQVASALFIPSRR